MAQKYFNFNKISKIYDFFMKKKKKLRSKGKSLMLVTLTDVRKFIMCKTAFTIKKC